MSKPYTKAKMLAYLEKHFTTARVDGDTLVVSGEHGDEYKGLTIYDYWAEGSLYELGVLVAWEKELNDRGWYSQWIDAGTVRICLE